MMAAPQRDATLVSDSDDVVGMDSIEKKAHQASPANSRAEEANAAHGGKLFEGVGAQFLVVVRNIFAANRIEIIHRSVQSDSARNIRSAGLEAVGSRFPGAVMIIDREKHLAAAAIGRGCLEAFGAAIKDSEAGRAAHFVAGKRQEIATDLLDIERAMTGALGCIDQCHDAALPGAFTVLCHGINRAKTVRDVSHGQELDVAGEVFVQLGEVEQTAVAIDRQENQLSADA